MKPNTSVFDNKNIIKKVSVDAVAIILFIYFHISLFLSHVTLSYNPSAYLNFKSTFYAFSFLLYFIVFFTWYHCLGRL